MTFEKNLQEYFISGAQYIVLNNIIGSQFVTCTGFTSYDCKGFHCRENKKLGMCNGKMKPTFDKYPDGYCAYRMNGDDKFIRICNTNEKW